MKDEDKQLAAGRATEVVMGVGSGKALSMAAYWRLLGTHLKDEDETDGTGEERFAPLSDEELEQRFAALQEMTPEPLPEEIENLSDVSDFLLSDEVKEEDRESTQGSPKTIAANPGRGSRGLSPWPTAALRWPTPASLHGGEWEEARRGFSAVLLVCAAVGGSARARRVPVRNAHRPQRAAPWTDVLFDVRSFRALKERKLRTEPEWGALSPLVREPAGTNRELLRDAVRTYFDMQPASIWIIVDNVGAAHDPGAALASLLADATSFAAAAGDDGRWNLLVTAPASTELCGHAVSRPRLAILQLPDDPPDLQPDSAKSHVGAGTPAHEPDSNDGSLELARRILSALMSL
ncbi:hypothetical protein [Streptomyces sp. NPDC053367]|uniref:hypothetical protein n=1 Tax=Streptomyces sp. NPDC053367 TaxID=3365700 RepID=UPI0037D0B677